MELETWIVIGGLACCAHTLRELWRAARKPARPTGVRPRVQFGTGPVAPRAQDARTGRSLEFRKDRRRPTRASGEPTRPRWSEA